MPTLSRSSDLDAALAGALKETIVHADQEKVVVQTTQDVETIREVNRRQRDEFDGYKDNAAGLSLTHAARIPLVILQQIKDIHGLDWYRADWSVKQRILGIIQRDYPDCMTVKGNPFGRKL